MSTGLAGAPLVGNVPPTQERVELDRQQAVPLAAHTDDSSKGDYSSGESTADDARDERDGQVDVAAAKQQFEELRRHLSRQSSLHRTRTGQRDPEKGDGSDSESDFDLRAYLHEGVERRDAAGFRRKALGVSWDKLRVKGAGGMKIYIRTFPDAIKEFFLSPVFFAMKKAGMFKFPERNLLNEFDGCAKPGEMVFVLGRPGSGCTTFLKTIGLQRGGYIGVDGDVSYGGIDSERMAKEFLGEVVYNQEDDIHHATLTVGQTLKFALNLKTPGKRLPDESQQHFKDTVLELILKMLGISHTRDTKVGSAQVRGVSGGERKRVSIAEQFAARASVCCWDNSSRGLDASTALDFAKSLRILTDTFQLTTFVSLYQAGEGIYDQMDKVLVIDEGRQVYFGPAKEARQYMISLGYKDLPRQTTADYLTGCTDPNERQLQEDRDPSTIPLTSEAMEKAFKESAIYDRMIVERDAFKAEVDREKQRHEDFVQAVRDDKHRGLSKKSPYTVSFPMQVWALAIRQTQLKLQDRLDLFVSFSTSIVVALISGSCYWQLPASSGGAFTRGGTIFMAVLFTSFQAFNELPSQMMGRPILWKHANFAFHRPAALSLAATLADAPWFTTQIILFSVIIYFMSGLYASAGAFFSFLATVLSTFFAMASFFRLLGTLTSSYDVAARAASILITGMILYSGYLIPVFSMRRWLFWIYYINPLNYGFSAAMMNEFKRLEFPCDGNYVVPRNFGDLNVYPTELGPNQACTLLGYKAGSTLIRGADYIKAAFDYDVSHQWRNFGITLVFFFAFSIAQMWAVETFKHGADAPAINVFKKEDKELKELNEKLQANKEAYRKGEKEQNLKDLVSTRKPLTWEHLTYTVPVPGGQRQLLDSVFGFVKPGTLTALMGSSGAGKTTLLDVLASRKTIGVIGGDVLIAGRKPGVEFQRGTAYCEQLDTHEHTATVREALRFSAYLRQPADVPKAEKDEYVEEIIQLLEMEDIADAMIGFPGFGLGVEARKRVTIGVELASKPSLLLFLDEPTSGLDGQSAYNIVRFLKKLAAAGQAILCTIHQPNSMLFESFDRLLLLKAGGRTVYFGDINGPGGKDSAALRAYLSRYGAETPSDANPAEFMLEAIGAGSSRQIGKKDWADIWLESPEFAQVKQEIQQLKEESLALPHEANSGGQYATSFWTQMKVVRQRTYRAFYRSPDYCWTRLFTHISIALFVSLTFLNLNNSLVSLQYRVFALFFVTVLPAIIISSIEPTFIMGRVTFIRESSSKMYSQQVFALSQLAAEMPYSLLCAVAFFLLLYYPMGFNTDSSRAGLQFLVVLVVELFSVTLGQAIAAYSPSIYIAAIQNPFFLVILSLFCGVTAPIPTLPAFYRAWLPYLNPFTHIISAMVTTELHDLPVVCQDFEYSVFNPPAGQTCGEWAGPFVQAVGGYINNLSATSACQYCQYAVGDEFFKPLQFSYESRWSEWAYLLAYTAFNCLVTIVASTFLTYAKR
ncbi:ATP-binding cassette transporter snq2 [Microbotryomycetes sp. JL201]|nr:ATP-binding cassette transporter snq2 [Microbotryomycetes sp. JL201]